MNLASDIQKTIESAEGDDAIKKLYIARWSEGTLTRDENPATHFCVYFLPYNKERREVFLVHHKKAGLWLSPGGHIDKEERIHATLTREIGEELGIANPLSADRLPELLSVTYTTANPGPCEAHFDMWYFVPTDGSDFHVDMEEFHDVRWCTFSDAHRIVRDKNNDQALQYLAQRLS